MLRIIGLLVLVLSSVTATFDPTISVTCSPFSTTIVEFVVTISGLTDNSGSVYIEDHCATQTTSTDSSTTYTFGDSCTSTIAMDESVDLIVRENALFAQLTDKRVTITCTVSADKTITSEFTASLSEAETTEAISYDPDLTIAILDSIGDTATSATLGDSISLSITMDNYATNGIDFQLSTLTASLTGGDTVTVISSGCSDYSSIIGNPTASSSGSFSLTFLLFSPFNTQATETSSVVTFSATVTFCDGTCTQTVCAKRRRRDVSNNATSNTVDIATALVVYPPGSKLAKSIRASDVIVLDEVCLSRTPLIGMIIGMAIALAICMGISAWMFCRLRKPSCKRPEAGFTNTSYQ